MKRKKEEIVIPGKVLVKIVTQTDSESIEYSLLTKSKLEFIKSWVEEWMVQKQPKDFIRDWQIASELLAAEKNDHSSKGKDVTVLDFFESLNKFLNYILSKGLSPSFFENDTMNVVGVLLEHVEHKKRKRSDVEDEESEVIIKPYDGSEKVWKHINKIAKDHDWIKGEIFKEKVEWKHRYRGSGIYSLRAFIEVLDIWKYNGVRPFQQTNLTSSMIYDFMSKHFTIDGLPIDREKLADTSRKKDWIKNFKKEVEANLELA